MKTKSFLPILTLLAVTNISSIAVDPAKAKTEFGGNTAPISADELHAVTTAKSLDAKVVRLRVNLADEDKPTLVEVKIGQQAIIEIIREFRYPTEFDVATVDPKTKAITPTTPTTFEVTNTGVSIQIESSLKGPFIVFSGKFSSTTFEGYTQNAGDPFRPIADKDGKLVSPNHVKMPMFTTRTTPFYALLLPGKEDSFSVLTDTGIKRMTMKCEVVK